MQRRKHSLTLIEVMIVMVIIGVVASVVAISVQGVVRQQRFRSEVDLVLDRLRLAQDLMLIADADVEVIFKKGKKGIEMALKTDAALTGAWSQQIKKSNRALTTITSLEFDRQRNEFTLKFLSGGSVMSRGSLRLFAPANQERFVCLLGYPHPIVASLEGRKCEEIEDPFYDSRLTFFTQREVEEKKEEESLESKEKTD